MPVSMPKVLAGAAAVLLLSGCAAENSISSSAGGDPNWQVTIEQTYDTGIAAPKIPTDVFDRVVKVDPQFKSGKYTAALHPLGQSVVDGSKVTRFALSLNLPKNCFGPVPDKSHGSGDCVTFSYTATGSRGSGSGPEGGVSTSSNVVELQGTKGVSVLEMTTPEDAQALEVSFEVGGKRVSIDPLTGKAAQR